MSREVFSKLCEDLEPLLYKKDTNFRKAIPVQKRVAVALYFLKSGIDFSVLSDLFCIGQSTVRMIVQEFLAAAAKKYNGLIKFPTEAEKEDIAKAYESKWQYYDCFGAVDGTHIPILAPQENAEEYYCYKSFHSINVLALTDNQYLFRYILSGAPGSCNDPSILNRSSLSQKMEDLASKGPPKYHIIGDGIFALKTWLMKPFEIRNNMPIMEENFNYRLSSARMTIENAFGRLKARWRVLLSRPDVHVDTMRRIIYVCFLLHNFCEMEKQGVLEEWIEDSQREENNLADDTDAALVNDQTTNATAEMIRIGVARRLYHDSLSVNCNE